jgi:hypothetical protein
MDNINKTWLSWARDLLKWWWITKLMEITKTQRKTLLSTLWVLEDSWVDWDNKLVFSDNGYDIIENNMQEINNQVNIIIEWNNKKFLEEEILWRELTKEEHSYESIADLIKDDWEFLIHNRRTILLYFKEQIKNNFWYIFWDENYSSFWYWLISWIRSLVVAKLEIISRLERTFEKESVQNMDLTSNNLTGLFDVLDFW